MSLDPALRYTDDEAQQLLGELFPHGWAAADVMEELAPEGWEASPLVLIFHPTPEQQYEEAVRMHENLQQLEPARRTYEHILKTFPAAVEATLARQRLEGLNRKR